MPRLKLSSPNDNRIDYKFRSSGPIQDADDAHEEVSGNEVRGHLSTGDDEISFAGVPLAFTASAPWELDITLDMGGGHVEWVPTLLNAPTVTVRSDGAHYLLGTAGLGMIVRDDKADPKDGVVDGPNHLVAGNVREGGEDSWRVWPPLGIHGVADNPTEFRVEGGEWRSINVCKPTMEF